MPIKIIKTGTKARNELIKGADFLANAVRSTLGPFGSNFLLEKGGRITNDGATVAREMELKDEIQHRGLVALREATLKTNDIAGDGTTTATVLAQAIYKEAIKQLGDDEKGLTAKKTNSEMIRQIEAECKEVVEKLTAMATPITTEAQLIESAKVSVEDDELGSLIGKTQWEIGKEGVIIAEESADRSSSVERIAGIRIDNGLGTSSVINNEEKQSLEVQDTRVILTNNTLQDLKPLQNIINALVKQGTKSITIVARAYTTECIQICLQNINQGGIKIYPINAPYTDQSEVMKDLAAVLGGTYYNLEERALEDMQLSDVGYASKIIAYRYTAIFAGKDDDKTKDRVAARSKELQDKLAGSQSEFEKKNLGSRIAQLTNGFGIVKIGSLTDTERMRLKDKADDCVNAVRHALREGTVPGAGLAYKAVSDSLPDTYILKRPLLSISEHIMHTAPKGFVVEDWIRDPLFVIVTALQNACTVAASLATAAGASATKRSEPTFVQKAQEEDPAE